MNNINNNQVKKERFTYDEIIDIYKHSLTGTSHIQIDFYINNDQLTEEEATITYLNNQHNNEILYLEDNLYEIG